MIGHQPLELLAGVLAAAISVMEQRTGLSPPPDRHHQGIGDKLGGHRGAHRSADHPPGEQVHDRRHIEPAHRCPDLAEVGDSFAVRSRGLEAAVQHVGGDGRTLAFSNVFLESRINQSSTFSY